MAFDPDAYLHETGGFDPDEYLKGKRVPLDDGLPTTELPEYQNLGAAETIGAIPRKLKAAGGAVGGMVESTGGAIAMSGKLDESVLGTDGVPGHIAKFEKEIGSSISEYGRKMQEFYKIADPTFADKLTAAATSGAVFFVPGAGVARGVNFLRAFPKLAALTGAAASSAFESSLEAGAVYETVKATPGKTEADALAAAGKTFGANLALNTGLNYAGGVFGKVLPGGGATGLNGVITSGSKVAGAEAIQEGSQQAISNLATDRPVTEGVGESAVLGGIVGAGMSGVVDLAQRGPGGLADGPVPAQDAPTEPLAGQPLTGLPIEPQGAPEGPGGPPPAAPPTPVMTPLEANTLQFQIKQAIGLEPMVPLTQFHLDAAWEGGLLPADLAIKAGYQPAIQAAIAEKTQETVKTAQKIERPAEKTQVEAVDQEQQAADEAIQARRDELMAPAPGTGKPIYQMSEEEFTAMVRSQAPEISGEDLIVAYDDLQAEAKDLGLTDDTELERGYQAGEDAEPLNMNEPSPLAKLDLAGAQAMFPNLTEDQHKAMVKQAIDSGQILPDEVVYPDIKKYGVDKMNEETTRLQDKEEDKSTPILAMAWRQKFNKAAFEKEGFDTSALPGYFVEKGGLTPEHAAENAHEDGVISEYAQDIFFEALDKEIMKKEALGRDERTKWWKRKRKDGFKEERAEYKAILMSPSQDYQPTVPAFYSKIQRLIETKMSGPTPAAQLSAMIKGAGIKQEELEQFDIDTFLKDNPKPTKQHVLEHLRGVDAINKLKTFTGEFTTQPNAIRKQVEHYLGSELASMIPLKIMDVPVLLAIQNNKIRSEIIKSIPIDVVNILAKQGFSTDQFLGQPDMVGKLLTVDSRAAVSRGLSDSLQFVGTGLRTALNRVLSLKTAGGDEKLFGAISTSDLNPREIVSMVSPSGFYGINGDTPLIGVGGANATTKLPVSGSYNTWKGSEPSPTELAEFFNRHNNIIARSVDVVNGNNPVNAITPEIRKGALTEGFSMFAPGKTYEAGHVYEQGELFPEEPVTQANLDQAVDDVRKVKPVGQAHDLRKNPMIRQISTDFIREQVSSALGKRIDTIQDQAEIAALARHPGIEHALFTKIKGGKITGTFLLTSGKVGTVNWSQHMDQISAFLHDADEFYISHNHPSGNPTPSVDDIMSTKFWGKTDKRFKGHVVTDHKRYTAIAPDGTATAQEFRDEKQSFRTDMAKMDRSPAVVAWAQDYLQGGKLGIMFVDSQAQVMSFDQVDPRSDYNAYIKRHANKYGAISVFLVTGEAGIAKMTPRKFTGNYKDLLVLNADGSYQSALLGYIPGFEVLSNDYTARGIATKGQEGDFGFDESTADYNPEDYNKVLGRFKRGMDLTLRGRIDTPLVKGGLPRGRVGKLIDVDMKTGGMLVDFAGVYVVVPPNMFRETYRTPDAPQPGQKERQFIQTVRGYSGTAPEVKDSIAGNYDVITNEESLAKAKAAIAKDYAGALRMVYEAKEPTLMSNTVAILLIDRFQQEGNFDEAKRLIEHTAERNTRAGQAVQALAMYRRLTPEGILRYAESVVKQAQVKGNFEKLVDTLKGLKDDDARVAFAKRHGIPYMSAQQANDLYNDAIAVAKMEPGRARDIATGKMLAKISAMVPKTFWEKVSSLQILAQLLNPKTFIRNIGGNTLFLAFENFAQAAGVPIDMMVGKATGRRTVAAPSPATQAAGFKKGAKAGIEEALAGVEIQPINNKYDLPRASAFDSKTMKGLEVLLNISLKATDRAFYQAAFEDSLRGQIKLAKVENPTPEMVQIAHLDGLYRTFNDENALRTAFTKVKKAFNLGGKWGMGDMVIKYPGTPASILMRGVEYSPFGFVQAAYILAKAGTKANFNQRAFVQSTARALTGTGLLMGTGMILAALGLIRGKDDDKKNIRETEAAIGVRDYQLNVSGLVRFLASGMDPKAAVMRPDDLLVSYDWAQPAAINLAMGANIQRDAGDSGVVMIADAIEGASTTLEQQPLLQGISRFFRGQSVTKGALESVKDVPASFIPTLLSQIKQWTDNTARNLNAPGYFTEMGNKVRNKLPGLSGKLPPRVDVLGRIRKTYQNNSNNAFNVFLNPAFVTRYKPTPTTDLVLDIWARTGDTIQMSRIAPREITVEGVKRPLTEMEQAQFQHYIGERTSNVFNALSADPEFMGLEDREKAKELQGILTDIYNDAKISVLGVE
jgi:hypothetical protein